MALVELQATPKDRAKTTFPHSIISMQNFYQAVESHQILQVSYVVRTRLAPAEEDLLGFIGPSSSITIVSLLRLDSHNCFPVQEQRYFQLYTIKGWLTMVY